MLEYMARREATYARRRLGDASNASNAIEVGTK
jgi:hypothetical protein